MKVSVITDDVLKEELTAQGVHDTVQVEWLQDISIVPGMDACIDLLFTPVAERIDQLKKMEPALIIVNSVSTTLHELPGNFIRLNGWPSFLTRQIAEAACTGDVVKTKAEKIFACFNKTTEWVPDVPGFISARVVSMIINEAYFTLQDEVSSKEEIDTAMKLGTNYPYGPFGWSKKIGLKNVYELLSTLAESNKRYEPAALLKKEVFL
jgi:3-hydroxybutyryl-CoA dehydrogenase